MQKTLTCSVNNSVINTYEEKPWYLPYFGRYRGFFCFKTIHIWMALLEVWRNQP